MAPKAFGFGQGPTRNATSKVIHFIRCFACLKTEPLRSSRSLLPTNLPLFSRLRQLPIPFGMDLLLTPG
ncbi:MAG: hypothetical protein DMG57_04610 [Acidobacteria bacterium]|nr:MAG: hypothetical protein DMG57_04610 [Acidobacteriota bacterium]